MLKGIGHVVVLLTASASAHANQVWEEYGKRINDSSTAAALRDDVFGDRTNPANGELMFAVTDISIPGNSGLPVEFRRSFSVRSRNAHYIYNDFPLADWEIDLPNISGVFAPDWISGAAATPYKRCSVTTVGAARPPAVWVGANNKFEPYEFWSGHQLSLPGGGGGELLLLPAGAPRPGAGGPFYWTAPDQTRISCLSSIQNWSGGGEGFLAVAPDGTKYWFDWMAQYLEPVIESSTTVGEFVQQTIEYQHPRRRNVLYPTRVEDRFGNWVTYTYTNARTDPLKLTRIQASDGRQIDVEHDTAGRVSVVSTGGRSWTYQYTAINSADDTLVAVIQPDQSKWTINFAGLSAARVQYVKGIPSEPWRSCIHHADLAGPSSFTGSVTHPAGASAEFTVAVQLHGRSNVPVNCVNFTAPNNHVNDDLPFWPISYHGLALSQKRVWGPGLTTAAWSYTYNSPPTFYYPSGDSTRPICPVGMDCSIPRCTSSECAGHSTTTITKPDGRWLRYRHGNSFRYNEGKLLGVEEGETDSTLRNTSYTHDLSRVDQAYPARWGISPRMNGEGFLSEYHRPMLSRRILQQGTTLTQTISEMDGFANPTRVVRSSTLPGAPSRTEATAYHDNTAKWILGQVAQVTCSASTPASTYCNGGSTSVMSQTTFDPTWSVPVTSKSFGRTVQTLGWNTTATLASGQRGTVTSVTDGNSKLTTPGSWKRGIPQSIRYPATPEATAGATQTAVVNDSGWIMSTVDEAGFTTAYDYDPMGRLKLIDHPDGDSINWYDTTLTFEPVSTSEYGIAAGHWRQTVSTGNARRISYFDALWRPLVVREYDTANATGTQRFSRFTYDHEGRVTFASYPGAVNGLTTGTWTWYDALGRPTQVTQDSELGALTTKTEYLAGFKTRVTPPRGQPANTAYQTTTSYLAWDQPTTELPVAIAHPEGAFTDISRDPYGKPTSIKRRNSTGSVALTRSYVYDGRQQLCKSVEPETGATIMSYDNAGNLGWSKSGATQTATGTCNTADIPTAQRTIRTYDGRNWLRTLSFPDGRGNQSWTYTRDGLPATINTQNSGTGDVVTNTYAYNRRRLVEDETFAVNGQLWALDYTYERHGHLTGHTSPGVAVDLAPNALGQPSKAGTYATAVSYYPNGGIKQFTYGNGIKHTLSQNARGLPVNSCDYAGTSCTASAVLHDSYDYDQHGNVAAISDGRTGNRGDRDMIYDALDRLKRAVSPMFGTADYGYTVLDNLDTVKVSGGSKARNHTYVYDAKNQLTNVTNTTGGATVIGLGYDVQGNVQNKNGVTYAFDQGNRLRQGAGEQYRYDGHGRRVLSTRDGRNIYSLYGQDGTLRFQRDEHTGKTIDYVHLGGSLVAQVENAIPLSTPTLTVPASSMTGSYPISWGTSALATKYQVQERLGSGSWATIHDAAGNSKAISGKAAGTWGYRVRACSAATCGSWSAEKAVAVQLPPTGAPTLTVPTTGLNGGFTVSWTAVAAASAYQLQERQGSGSWVSYANSSALSRAITGKAAGSWSYQVRACNDAGCGGWSAIKSVNVLYPPAGPPTLTVPAASSTGSYTASWPGVATANRYQLQERLGTAAWTTIQETAAISKALSGQAAGQWSYQVRACNDAGCSAYSAIATIVVVTGVPTLTAPASSTSGSYTVSWTAVTAAARYELEQRKDGGSWSKVHDAAAISKALSGLANGTYEYRVRACAATVCAGYSAIKATVVLTGVPTITAPATNTTGSYTVSWTSVATASRYELEQRKDAGAWSKIHDAAATSRALSGQVPGSYAYRARACKGTVCGGWSAVVTTAVSGPPGTPTLTGPALAYRNLTYSLNWSASTGATNYELQEDPRGGGFGTIYTGGGTNTTLQRSLGGTYRYRVRACNGAGCSAYSTVHVLQIEAGCTTCLTAPEPEREREPDPEPDPEGGE
ncbi:RHS repeat protein [Luteimonas sp. M1R5S59]|uniref:RHS repeat protein n=2 Tax=Luteimonas kalidii TaxID=3042025 RepID=A0ABT6JNZ2_9GAMM|nr:RHS repeat protein [Luteimonas kalidii]MDH5832405.1 RHS repeat protein [Luteimonas kalidii]